MSPKKWSVVVLLLAYSGAALIFSWANKPSHAYPTAVFVSQDKKPPKLEKIYFGVSVCSDAGCHNNPMLAKQTDIILCDYNEVDTWTKFDKHKDANKVLKGDLAKQMAKLLDIPGDISKAAACVSCHGVLVEDDKLKHSSFKLEDGVSCVACHGAHEEWVTAHAAPLKREKWRKLSRQVKEEQFGMRDLWDPEKRATLCASCHIGNAGEGKIVTHAMYAAGHPPLPGIEMATFSDAMPRHWKYLAEKSPKVQAILGFDPAKADLERTQLAVIGGLVSFRESMNLTAALAAQDDGKNWPELAQFDCYACHHDLKSKSWRQKRGYSGTPGRPDMRPWPTALLPLAVLQADRDQKLTKEMHDTMKRLSLAFNAQPFGQPKEIADAARQSSQWADALLKDLKPARFDRAAANRLVIALGKESKDRLVDFDSARQLAWAFRSIQHELDPKYAANAETAKLLKDLDDQLKLDLPKGQVEVAKDVLKDSLEKLSNFEPERFNQTFDKLIGQRAK